jgi:hypothetical protein
MSTNDNRSVATHAIHAIGHQINAVLKENGHPGIENSGIYRSYSPNKNGGKPWSSEVDRKQESYHKE